MYEDLIARLRKMSKISAVLSVLLPKAGGDPMAELLEEAADALEKAGNLAADVRPVRRGQWEIRAYGIDGEDVYCSVCKCGSNMPYWPFCPMCGADMRGGDANG